MDKKRTLTRRQFLRVSALATAGAVTAACAGTPVPDMDAPEDDVAATATSAPEDVDEPTAAPEASDSAYSEAPELAALVAAGELPPVDERLPLEPFIVGPGTRIVEEHLDWEVGEYSEEGEVLRSVTIDPEWSYPCQHGNYAWFINTPVHHTGPMTGGVCSSWSMNDDATEYEFTLRKGMKWSDGVPVTTEDVRFAYEDFMMNEELTQVIGQNYRAGAKPSGEPMNVEIVDDFTFKVTFAEPNGRFLRSVGMGNLWGSSVFLLKPKHYMQQFHKDYTPIEDLKPLLEEEGLSEDEWYRLCLDKDFTGGGCPHRAEGYPVLHGWLVKESPDDLIIMERNPYYWRVDTEGKQLPYVGRIESVVVSNPENIPAKIVNCEGNYIRERLNHEDISLYKEHEEACGYRVYLNLAWHNAPVALFINYNNPDETWREIVWQKEFRQAINAAINYQEIIDVLFFGMGDPVPWLPQVNDTDLANDLLDQVGLDQRDDEGWRLSPDGTRFEFRMDVAINPLFGQPAEVIKAHLESVGLYSPLKQIESSLWVEMRDANQLYASINWLDDCNWPYLTTDYMPNTRIQWAQLWHRYMQTDGEEGEEPPEWILDLYDIHAELSTLNPNTNPGREAEERLMNWVTEYLPMFPLSRDVIDPVIIPANLANVATAGRSSAVWFSQEQVFFKH
jgi:peptide/nickel transport system substrate-binding protein